jgi:arylsulfatase A-like enzyme
MSSFRVTRIISLAVAGSLGLGLATSSFRSARAQSATIATTAPAATTPAPGTHTVRNVVLISIDALRADMPWNGYPRQIAPHLTEFAHHAVLYTHAYALSSYTSQSVGGFLGGRLPSELARDGQFFGRYPRSVVFFPERLHDAGIRTLGAHAHFYFAQGRAGFDQGFDVWQMIPTRIDFTTDLDVTGDRHEALAEQILSNPANTSGRFFAWFHFMDAHDRYLPHRGISYGRHLRDLYDAEVTFADQQVGNLLAFIDRQPWANDTAVIITSDHGEAFGEHHAFRHGFELWQPLVRVPLMVRLPGNAPRVIDVNRSHLDLAPTVLALMGVPPEPSFRGVSLVDELYGGPTPERDVMVDLADTGVNHARRALIHGNSKLLVFDGGARMELFDLQTDPDENTSLRRTDPARFDEMVTRYRAAVAQLHEVAPYGRH